MHSFKKKLNHLCFAAMAAVYLVGSSLGVPTVHAEEKTAIQIAIDAGNSDLTSKYAPKSAIVVDATTGRILFSENADATHVPASLTKLMTLYLTYEAMKEGKFDENTKVKATDKYIDVAGRFSLSNHSVAAGQEFTVRELIDALIVPSSAAAAFMLADLVMPNDVEGFTKKMNDTAARLKMTNTYYENPIGSPNADLIPYIAESHDPNADNRITATDYAILVSHFIADYPEVLQHTASSKITMSAGTPQEASYDGHNYSLPGQPLYIDGVDGFKTGSSPAAGYNVVGTAKRGETRLIAVVLGVSTWGDPIAERNRARIVNALLEDGFAKYEYRTLLSAGDQTVGQETVTLENGLAAAIPKGTEPTLITQDGRVTLEAPGSYLPGYSAPGVAYRPPATQAEQEETTQSSTGILQRSFGFIKKILLLLLILAGLLLLLILVLLVRKRIVMAKRRKRRAAQRQRRRKRS